MANGWIWPNAAQQAEGTQRRPRCSPPNLHQLQQPQPYPSAPIRVSVRVGARPGPRQTLQQGQAAEALSTSTAPASAPISKAGWQQACSASPFPPGGSSARPLRAQLCRRQAVAAEGRAGERCPAPRSRKASRLGWCFLDHLLQATQLHQVLGTWAHKFLE